MENKIYLFSSGGFIEAPEEWYENLREDQFTTDYDELKNGLYMYPSQQQIEFNLQNPGLNIHDAFYMISKSNEEINEEIREQRSTLYSSKTDKLYMAYIKYKEFGELDKAEEAYQIWKTAVLDIEITNPYIA